ncbi:MAG: hypothetical protein NDF54_12185 [archaeon GB-1867-035]|nr:hypothetical protein [Candidatus Culexmicrobium profundum]
MFFSGINRSKGLSILIGTIIIVSVAMLVAIGVALWMAGIIGQSGYGTRPIQIQVFGDLNVRHNEFKIEIKNMGGEIIYIDEIRVDNKYIAQIIEARSKDSGEDKLIVYSDGSTAIMIEPGEIIEIWAVVDTDLKAGMDHEIRIHTSQGLEFPKMVRATFNPLLTNLYAIDTGLKDPSDPGKKIVLFKISLKNTYTRPLIVDQVDIYSITNPKDPILTVNEWINGTSLSIIVPPGDSWSPDEFKELIRADLSPGKYIVKAHFTVQGTGEEDYVAGYANVGSTAVRAYVIYINYTGPSEGFPDGLEEHYPAWQKDPRPLISKLQQFFEVEIISSLSELKSFIENPPSGPLAVINVHSESLPIPLSYLFPYLDDNPSQITSTNIGNGVRDWYYAIKSAVANRWIWVQPTGYPFWGTSNKYYAYNYSSQWTDSWGRNYINPWSNLNPYTGGATSKGVTYSGVNWATGYSLGQTRTWRHDMTKTALVDEILAMFPESNLPTTTKGWDTADISSMVGNQIITASASVYYKDAASPYKPIAYALKVNGGDGWFLFISLARPQGWSGITSEEYDELCARLTVYLTVHLYLTRYTVEL